MDLRTLNMGVFLRNVQHVLEMLDNPHQRVCLLQSACADTPAVRGILAACCEAAASSEPDAADTLERMEQDLVTFLALREINACVSARASLAARRIGAASGN